MRLKMIPVMALLAAATLDAASSVASAQSCADLWIERNTYYKEAGYCFKTRRAIDYFGNGGCAYYNESAVPFPRGVRARINQIVAIERAYRCPR